MGAADPMGAARTMDAPAAVGVRSTASAYDDTVDSTYQDPENAADPGALRASTRVSVTCPPLEVTGCLLPGVNPWYLLPWGSVTYTMLLGIVRA